jgi:AcrR family transcriptional regulator
VTPAAVYRHFAGREDLIAEAARQGYEIFADLMMEYAYDEGQPSALAAFEATGRAYLAFAPQISRALQGDVRKRLSIAGPIRTWPMPPARAGVIWKGRGPAVGTSARRPPPAPRDVLGPYLGHEPRHGRAVSPAARPGSPAPIRPRTCWKPGSASTCAGWACCRPTARPMAPTARSGPG